MREFNLDEYLKNPSQKVVTRDGRDLRIICTDMKGIYKIVGLVYDKKADIESLLIYKDNGKYSFEKSTNDLFFAPTKREGWVNIYKSITKKTSSYAGQKIYKSEEAALKNKIGDNYIATTKIEWEE